MKKLFVLFLIFAFAATGVAFAKKDTSTTSKAKVKTTVATKEAKGAVKEMPKGIATASMEGQGKKKGLLEKWFGWGAPKSEKASKEAEVKKIEKEKKQTKVTKVKGGKETKKSK